jgi:hypothetical protein
MVCAAKQIFEILVDSGTAAQGSVFYRDSAALPLNVHVAMNDRVS